MVFRDSCTRSSARSVPERIWRHGTKATADLEWLGTLECLGRDGGVTVEVVTLLGKPVTRDDVLAALRRFDAEYRDTNDYDRWLDKGTYKYALQHAGRLYPCKYILSLASGWALDRFGGGQQTNRKLKALGFDVIEKPEKDLRAPGDSSEQQSAERWLLDALSQELGAELAKKKLPVDEDSSLQLDGYAETPLILCEAWAHVGAVKGGQKHKVMTDAIRLLFANSLCGGDARLILLFGDQVAARHFQGNSWMARCLSEFGIEVRVIEMSPELKATITTAQERQFR